ncbi:MAG: hypothetical protein ABFD69_16665 [Candidatus Sumerlaeia bacterium]
MGLTRNTMQFHNLSPMPPLPSITRKTLIAVFLLALAPCAFGQSWQQFDLINKRLTVSMPRGSTIGSRAQGIMGAAEPTEQETVIIYEDSGNKLVLLARELFKFAGKDFDGETSRALKRLSGDMGSHFVATGIGGNKIIGVPDKPKQKGDSILYGVAFVRHADGTVLRVSVYFNPSFHKAPNRCRELTQRILASIATGPRRLNLDAGVKKLDLRADGITLSTPRNWVYTVQDGIDFTVYHLTEMSEFEQLSKNISIYVGWCPSYFHEKIDKDLLFKGKRTSLLFGRQQEWVEYWNAEEDPAKNIEMIAKMPETDGNTLIHIFGSAGDDKGIAAILDIIATAKIEKTPGAK